MSLNIVFRLFVKYFDTIRDFFTHVVRDVLRVGEDVLGHHAQVIKKPRVYINEMG